MDFKVICEALPGHFLILAPDAPDYTILAISDELLRITGREREQIVGKSVFDLFSVIPDTITATGPATLRGSLQKAIETKQPTHMPVVRYEVVTADGVLKAQYGSSRTKPVLDQAGEVRYLIHSLQEKNDQVPPYNEVGEVDSALVLSTDRTERKRAEEALQESAEKYHILFAAMDEGFFLCEVLFDQTGSPVDIHYREANPAATRMVGEGFTGRLLKEINPGYEAYWYEIFGRVALSGQAERGEHYAEPAQKWYTFYVFKVGGEHARKVAVIFRDITGRKRREANLAFLADVADAMSRLSTIEEIMATVGAKIGAYLRIKSCSFVDVDDKRGEITVFDAWNTANVPGLRSHKLRLSDFASEELSRASRAGEVFVVNDTRTDPRIGGKDHTTLGIAAYVNVPFHRQGAWTNNLAITDSEPRQWREDEIELFGELSNRIFPRLERARAEAALRESEQRFRLMADAVPQIVWITDPEGHNEFFNKQWFLYTGAPYEPTTAAEVATSFVHPDDGPATMAAFTQARATGTPFRVEHRIRSKAGDYRWFLVRAEPYCDLNTGQISRWFGASVDIHDRKQAEGQLQAFTTSLEALVAERTQALRESQELLQSVFDTSQISVLVLRAVRDEAGGVQDFRIVMGNRELAKQTGRTDLAGKRYSQEFPGVKLTGVYELMMGVLATGEPVGME